MKYITITNVKKSYNFKTDIIKAVTTLNKSIKSEDQQTMKQYKNYGKILKYGKWTV